TAVPSLALGAPRKGTLACLLVAAPFRCRPRHFMRTRARQSSFPSPQGCPVILATQRTQQHVDNDNCFRLHMTARLNVQWQAHTSYDDVVTLGNGKNEYSRNIHDSIPTNGH